MTIKWLRLKLMEPKKQFLIRIDKTLYDQLEKWAADELRSVNSQIEYILREAVAKRKGWQSPGTDSREKMKIK